jgi:PhoPQ-activated pathogenicity-related protein
VFWLGAPGDVSSTWRDDNVDGGNWHQQFGIAIPNSVRTDSSLAALSRNSRQTEAFWIGSPADVSSTWQNDLVDGGVWHRQFGIAIPNSVRAGSPLVALSRDPHQTEVFWIGSPGDVSSNWQNDNLDGGRWHQQFAIAIQGRCGPTRRLP